MSPRRPGVRQVRRDDVTARILAIGRAQLAEHGAAALSLRAVTRELGMVSSAVYRYVANRDDLITLLVVDAYDELGDAVDAAVRDVADRPWSERLLAAGHAVRRWALREPARYALLYGSPIPGYAAPPERTVEPGTRVILALLALVAEGVAVGDVVNGEGAVPVPPALRTDLTGTLAELGVPIDAAVLARAIGLWATLFGAVSLEVFGQYGTDTFLERRLLFDHQLRSFVESLRGRPTG